MTNRKPGYILIVIAAMFLSASCSPVNFTTRTKKVPRQYSVNYNYDNVKAEYSDLNRKAWVVYSDRDANATTMRPGGTLTHKELGYMEPVYVVGRKGDYYKLIKYDPSVLKNEQLAKHKEAEFYGWIQRDRLLLFNNSETEVRNGIKLKSLTAITDCSVALEAEKYFANDSLLLYSDPKQGEVRGSIGLNNIVYVLKSSEDGSRLLISQKTNLSPDEVDGIATGWADASLIVPFGQRLVLNSPPSVMENPVAPDTLPAVHPTVSPVSLSPAIYAGRVDSVLVFRTLDATDIIDHSGNRIYNVNGAPITYEQGQRICASLNHINVIFAFIPTKTVLQQTPMISNAIQNLKPVFDSSPGFGYRFGAVLGGRVMEFESGYLSFSDKLIEAGKKMEAAETTGFTAVVRGALKLASLDPDATNVIILTGEKSPGWNSVPQDIQKELVDNNCRLLSYQVYADNDDTYNNFVLQSLDMIEYYAEKCRIRKRDIIVYSDQVRTQNLFTEGVKNAYSLDFPARSMTQGMVIFPEKGRFSEPELLRTGVDSLINQVASDNQNLIKSIDRAFMQVGRHRSRFHYWVSQSLGIDPQTPITAHIGKAFNETSPQWVAVTDRIGLRIDSLNMTFVGLLLTDVELEGVKTWVGELASMKPDRKGDTSSDKQKLRNVQRVRRDLRGVPADVSTVKPDEEDAALVTDSLEVRRYASTKSVRKNVYDSYMNALRGCVFEGKAKRLTLAQCQEYITTMPTISSEMNCVRIKDLKNKKRFTDEELDLTIQYFEEHVKLIEIQAVAVDELTVTGGEQLFFLPSAAMP